MALTGTPGTGKSTVARALVPGVIAVELRDLAAGLQGRAPGAGAVTVDLRKVRRWMGRHPPPEPVVVAGYLSHRLPVRAAFVLRCHPRELAERLRRRREPAAALRDNVLCEALDTLSGAARDRRAPIVEIDTTGRSPAAVARRIAGALTESRPRSDRVDWLADPEVPPFLLGLPR